VTVGGTEALPLRVAILTVSDLGSRGEREDRSGDLVEAFCRERGFPVAFRSVVPDETSAIVPLLLRWCDAGAVDLVLTTGGTGFGPRDVTPEATRAVLERDAPGMAEELRRRGLETTPYAVLSRGMVGVRGRTLLVNLPGSPGGVRDGLAVLEPLLLHMVGLVTDRSTPHRASSPGGP